MRTRLRTLLNDNRRDHGFTLPELLITVVISGMIATSLGMTIVVSLRLTEQTSGALGDSGNTVFVTAYFGSDAQEANTITVAPTAPACGTGTLLVGFEGSDFGPMPGSPPFDTRPTEYDSVVSYVLEPTVNSQGLDTFRLIRNACWPTGNASPDSRAQVATDLATGDNPATPTIESAPTIVCYQQAGTPAQILAGGNVVACTNPAALLVRGTFWSATNETSFEVIGTRRTTP